MVLILTEVDENCDRGYMKPLIKYETVKLWKKVINNSREKKQN